MNDSEDLDKVNILIVDDLPEKLLVFRSILEDLQQNLVLVHSGREALRQVLEREFAVILLDVNMPDIDGFETAALIRQYKRTAQTPIVFITAYVDEIQAIRGYSLGAVDYIASPVVPEILRSKIKVFVDLHRMHRQLRQQAAEREALARAEAARAAAEQATRRADFLAEASHVLTQSLDVEATIQGVLRLAVPVLADVAVLTLVNELGEIHRTECAWQDDSQRLLEPGVGQRRIELPPRLLVQVQEALRAGDLRSFIEPGIWRAQGLVAEQGVRAATELSVHWATVFPLFAGDRALGALVLAFGPSRTDSAADLPLAKEVASRAAIALENGLLYRAIQEGDRRKNEFLAMLAHELRNPLAPIRNAVHVIQLIGPQEPKLVWARDIIGRQVDHMARIVDDLLDVSRIARGKVAIQEETILLDAVIERSVEASQPLITAHEHQLTVQIPDKPILLRGDMIRLAQVLSNLLNNAAKYTAPNGQIWLTSTYARGEVKISVRDDGQGIAPEFLPRVFDLFAQGDQSIDRAQGGLGVGLTLVKHLVELHRGRVEARSSGQGTGAEFIIYLPAQESTDHDANSRDKLSVDAIKPGFARILVVDDLVPSAESLRTLLEMKGYQVETAYDSATGLRIAETLQPQVVVLDIGLPGMDGFEVARQLRKRPEMKTALLIALTGYGQAEDRIQAIEAGFDAHLVKPADIALLFSMIARYCARRQLIEAGGADAKEPPAPHSAQVVDISGKLYK